MKFLSISVAVMVLIGIVVGVFALIDRGMEKRKEDKVHMLNLIKEGKLKRSVFELQKYKTVNFKEHDIYAKQNKIVRKWEEGSVSYFSYYVKFINSKGSIRDYDVLTTIKIDTNVDKPMYSYYHYKGKVYNPIIHLPKKDEK